MLAWVEGLEVSSLEAGFQVVHDWFYRDWQNTLQGQIVLNWVVQFASHHTIPRCGLIFSAEHRSEEMYAYNQAQQHSHPYQCPTVQIFHHTSPYRWQIPPMQRELHDSRSVERKCVTKYETFPQQKIMMWIFWIDLPFSEILPAMMQSIHSYHWDWKLRKILEYPLDNFIQFNSHQDTQNLIVNNTHFELIWWTSSNPLWWTVCTVHVVRSKLGGKYKSYHLMYSFVPHFSWLIERFNQLLNTHASVGWWVEMENWNKNI